MYSLQTLVSLVGGVALVQGLATPGKLPIVDLDYAVHSATVNVSHKHRGPDDLQLKKTTRRKLEATTTFPTFGSGMSSPKPLASERPKPSAPRTGH